MKSKNIAIFLNSQSGRMGQEILNLIKKEKNFSLEKTAQNANVIVDFTSPQGAERAAQLAEKSARPLICGTTGLTKKEMGILKKASKKIAVLHAPNMSLGIATLTRMLRSASALKNYDFYIEETHHNHKKDMPSGTALLLQEHLEKAIDKKIKQNISLRGGGVFGQHRVVILGPEETLILQHDALNRTVFARGALTCAQWIIGQKPGFYTIEDVLGGSTT